MSSSLQPPLTTLAVAELLSVHNINVASDALIFSINFKINELTR